MIRLYVPHAGARPLIGEGIIVLKKGDLVLVVDEQEKNHGASATNAMGEIVAFLEQSGMATQSSFYVELDSMGYFDEVTVLERSPYGVKVSWRALRSANHARTLEAFLEKYGDEAKELIAELAKYNAICHSFPVTPYHLRSMVAA